jgi:hypothetical protein
MEPIGESKQISGYTDQVGNPVSREHMFRMVSESMLATVVAVKEAGVPLKEQLKQAEGRDRGTILGRGLVFQTHTEKPAREVLGSNGAPQDYSRTGEAR